ncbi:derlin-1 isoform X1 [Brachionus plicatilis]|uniref:Derlin n=1 Tax=Brachionus plicatilis TaxID=10195 RepID=A0A3M7QJA0_BRAPC|nr:derlin-1 isoform X1 [Brachionus plicatilis]
MSAVGTDFKDWFNSIPKITRFWFSGSVIIPILSRLGILNPIYLILLLEPFLKDFHFWRPVTALFFYPITPQSGFSYLINLYFLYTYSVGLENSSYEGKPADYLFMLVFNWLILTIVGFILKFQILMDPMIMSVMYIWSQINRDQIVSFWFGTRFKALYLPWVLLAFNMIIRGSGISELVGILVGHLYFFLMFRYPETNGIHILKTPEILYKYFPSRRTNFNNSARRENNVGQNRNLRGGYRLGD